MGLRAREADVSFADLICADPQWLRRGVRRADLGLLQRAARATAARSALGPAVPRLPVPPLPRRPRPGLVTVIPRPSGRTPVGSAHPRNIPRTAARPPPSLFERGRPARKQPAQEERKDKTASSTLELNLRAAGLPHGAPPSACRRPLEIWLGRLLTGR